jgi:hypothetical protein
VSDDPHAPTTAGPTPEPSPSVAQAAAAKASAVRDSVVGAASGAGEAAPSDRPEILAGAAFAGGLVVALVLKRLTR